MDLKISYKFQNLRTKKSIIIPAEFYEKTSLSEREFRESSLHVANQDPY